MAIDEEEALLGLGGAASPPPTAPVAPEMKSQNGERKSPERKVKTYKCPYCPSPSDRCDFCSSIYTQAKEWGISAEQVAVILNEQMQQQVRVAVIENEQMRWQMKMKASQVSANSTPVVLQTEDVVYNYIARRAGNASTTRQISALIGSFVGMQQEQSQPVTMSEEPVKPSSSDKKDAKP